MNRDEPAFCGGLDLSEHYWRDCVAPAMALRFPGLAYGAALIGDGSEVLGYDTALSADHSWGPRLFLFLREEDMGLAETVRASMARELPAEYAGLPTDFHCAPFEAAGIPVHPRGVAVTSVRLFCRRMLGADPLAELHSRDWLTMPEHRLLGVTAGRVFQYATGELAAARQTLRQYPKDVWLYLMAARWARIGEERAFLGRCGDVGDDLGSRVVAARLAKEVMGLCFLMERAYAPYAKWFGTAFARLACAPAVQPALQEALSAAHWRQREAAINAAYEAVARLHNSLGVTEPLEDVIGRYYTRPYRVVDSDRFCDALLGAIQDPWLKGLRYPLGSVNQFLDQTNLLCDPQMCVKAAALFLE